MSKTKISTETVRALLVKSGLRYAPDTTHPQQTRILTGRADYLLWVCEIDSRKMNSPFARISAPTHLLVSSDYCSMKIAIRGKTLEQVADKLLFAVHSDVFVFGRYPKVAFKKLKPTVRSKLGKYLNYCGFDKGYRK